MNASLLNRTTVNPNQCGVKPCIRVTDVLDLRANEIPPQQIVEEELPDLELADVYVCLAFKIA